jgi:molybdate transport system ATP-binding protein
MSEHSTWGLQSPRGVSAQLRLPRGAFTLDVNLQLPGHGVTALFGPSGCGKTTCLRAIAGLERARPGVVVVNGEVWQDDNDCIWRATHQRRLGYVFQEASLFDHLTVRGNIGYGMRRLAAGRKAVEVSEMVDLLGIAHLMDRKPNALSGGERQRVAMARALCASPHLLLMDEPLAALDAARKAEVLPYLQALHRDLEIPVIYVSHSIDEIARLADYMVVLRDGSVLAQGPTHELMVRMDLPLAHGDAAASVVEAEVLTHDARDHVTTVTFDQGTLLLVSAGGHAPGERLRLRIQARDVSVTLSMPAQTSILNVLPATVMQLTEDSPGQCMVLLAVGGARVLARVTQRSARALALSPGQPVFAQIKGVAIVG